MNAQSLVAKVWNFAHVLRDQGVSYQEVLGVKSGTLSVTSGHTHSVFAEGTYKLDSMLQ